MGNKKTHWRKLDNPNYLGAYSLLDGQTKSITVTIEKVVLEDVKNAQGSESCKVAYLKGQKPMILNATNCKAIESVHGTPFIDDWAGKDIVLYVAKIKAFGEQIDALRVKREKPKTQLPELKPTDTANWDKVVKALVNGYTIGQIETKWRISESNRVELMNQAV